MKTLLSRQNAKTIKGEKYNYLTYILYLAPSTNVKGINTCKFASKGCKEACLYTAGRGRFNNVKQARVNRTELLRDNIDLFMYTIYKDIIRAKKRAAKLGMKLAIRLNGTSDIVFENIVAANGKNIFEVFPEVQFYDYTKDFTRVQAFSGTWSNYHLTFSMNESRANQRQAWKLLNKGVNVAMVFDALPKQWYNFNVVNGDDSDLRFLDAKQSIVGLIAKGDAKKDTSGFVTRIK